MAEPTNIFREPPAERAFPTTAVAIASVAILIIVAVLVLVSHRKPAAPIANIMQPEAPYSQSLTLTQIEMSEAESQLGGKSTYIDGHIANHGMSTVTGIMAQVIFPNSDGTPPEFAPTQMLLISSREPYIDTEMISTAPIAPGTEADFRLIFESVPTNWNTQPPTIRLTAISTK